MGKASSKASMESSVPLYALWTSFSSEFSPSDESLPDRSLFFPMDDVVEEADELHWLISGLPLSSSSLSTILLTAGDPKIAGVGTHAIPPRTYPEGWISLTPLLLSRAIDMMANRVSSSSCEIWNWKLWKAKIGIWKMGSPMIGLQSTRKH